MRTIPLRVSILLMLAFTVSAATFTIDAGSTRFGNTIFRLSQPVRITTTGAPASLVNGFVFVDARGVLNVSLPPGVSGSCSGLSPCNVFTGDPKGGARNGANGYDPGFFWIDPIYSATASAAGAVSLFADVPPPPENIHAFTGASGFANGAGVKGGMRFRSSANGYIVGIRYYKVPGDTSTAGTGQLTSDDGSQVWQAAHFTWSSSATGWQTAYFTTPVAITANTIYQAAFTSAVGGGIAYVAGGTQNISFTNGPLHSIATFNGGNGSCNVTDAWPQIADGRGGVFDSAGILGCVTFHADGSATAFSGDPAHSTDTGTDEGCQCMIGGVGPGPYALINSIVEGNGNVWHHDLAGGMHARNDYYYYRDIFRWPEWSRLGFPGADGFIYRGRQLLEWKGGSRIHLEGMLLENAWNSIAPSSLMISPGNQSYGVRDVSITNSEFRHGPGLTNLTTQYTNSPPPIRNDFSNNLIWDMSGYGDPQQQDGHGWILEYPGPTEDFTFSHNTILPLRGWLSDFMYIGSNNPIEGAKFTDNIIPIASGYGGHYGISGDAPCDGSGDSFLTCSASPWTNYRFDHNILYPSNWSFTDNVSYGIGHSHHWASRVTARDIRDNYPKLKNSNYIPSSTDLSTYGWYRIQTFPPDSTQLAAGLDPRLRSDSMMSEAAYKPSDGKNLGADIQAIRDAQGVVEAVTVPANLVTATSAAIVFTAPDSQGCPVDYAVDNPGDPYLVGTFTRVKDTGTGRARQVNLTGLRSGTTYCYRVNCAAQQPLGKFRTGSAPP